MLNLITRLFPRARAWRIALASRLRDLLTGFASLPSDAREFVDGVYDELKPGTTTNLAEWERQFGINFPASSEADRRIAIASKWAATGGQSPRYIEDTLRDAGFNVFVHEWWEPPNTSPRTVRDPRTYADDPLIGSAQCVANGSTQHECFDQPSGPQCDRWLQNEVNYIVNDDLTPVAPPPIPSESDAWRYFVYIGGKEFPEETFVNEDRRDELRELILSVVPAHLWVVTLVEYTSETLLVTEDYSYLTTEAGDFLTV